jgi:hypothetical protein
MLRTGCDTAIGRFTQGQDAGAVSGRPTMEGVYSSMVQVSDATGATGATDGETFGVTALPPRPVTIGNAAPAPSAPGTSSFTVAAGDFRGETAEQSYVLAIS